MTLSGTVSISQLRTDFDSLTTTIATNATGGGKDHNHTLRLAALTDVTALSARSLAWTPQDDQELRLIGLRITDGTAGRSVAMSLTVDNGDSSFLLGYSVTASVTTVIGTADSRQDWRTTTGNRLRLLKGVRYRLALVNNTPATTITGPLLAWVQTRCIRRRA